jgi:hypothetical protein
VVERISKEFGVDAWSWLRPEDTAPQESGPRVVYLRNDEAEEDREDNRWRLRALDLLSHITDLVEGILKNSGKRGGGLTDPGTTREALCSVVGFMAYGVLV